MPRNTESSSPVMAEPSRQRDMSLPPFLAAIAKEYLGEYVAVHTGRNTYSGKLLSVTPVCLTLYADSDALDQPVHLRIDSTRIEAIEVLPE